MSSPYTRHPLEVSFHEWDAKRRFREAAERAEEPTRPDNVSVRQWRQVVLALRAVPPDRRDLFADAVMQLAESYRA